LQGGREKWEGGHIHVQKDGRPLFVIERQVGGRRFHVSTRCHSRRAALKQLERFEADPASYQPGGEEAEAALMMTDILVEEYGLWMTEEKGTTRRHANQMRNRLSDWCEDLGTTDLRTLTLRDHIAPALQRRKTCRPARIIAIKAFYAWLRKTKHLLTSAQDPTLDLPVPQARPEKWKRRKAISQAQYRGALAKLTGAYRDCLLLLGGTGMHTTELERFVRSADSEIVDLSPAEAPAIAVLRVKHKSGKVHPYTLQFPEHRAAAVRLRARGEVPRKLNAEIKNACAAAKVEVFTAGVMRHSVATWAVELGASPQDVSEFLGHSDKRTSERFYIDVARPTRVVPVFRVIEGG
jgi:integrase